MSAILITGATGKTSEALIEVLSTKYPSFQLLAASRSGKDVGSAKGVEFDWSKSETYDNPFKMNPSIDRLHIVGSPTSVDTMGDTKPFIEFCRTKGVKRFVFIGATIVRKGDPNHGQLHKWFSEQNDLEYAVIRPSWFFQNFLIEYRLSWLRDENRLVTAAGDASAGWVDVMDIAEVSAKALTEETPRNGSYIIIGPERLTYDQMASIFSEVMGREIKNDKVSSEKFSELLVKKGWPEEVVGRLNYVETEMLGKSLEAPVIADEEKILGKVSFRDFVKANKSAWIK